MNEYKAFWQNYLNFTDRTTVKGFWIPILINMVISGLLIPILGGIPKIGPLLSYLFPLAVLIPNLAISVRRLNDAGKNWMYIFFGLIPCVGMFILIYFWIQPTVNYSLREV